MVLAIAGALGRWVWLPANPDFGSSLNEIPVYSYGVMLGVSLVVGWYLTLGLLVAMMSTDTMANCYVVTAIAAVAGLRILYVLTNLDEFHSPMDVFAMRSGGLVAYGGFLGGFVGSWVFLNFTFTSFPSSFAAAIRSRSSLGRRRGAEPRVRPLHHLHRLLLVRLRLRPSALGFRARLAEEARYLPRWPGRHARRHRRLQWRAQHVKKNGLSPDSLHSLPVHPTQIYESLLASRPRAPA